MLYFSFIYLLISVFYVRKFEGWKRFLIIIFPFIVLIFLRYGVGADYFSYQNIYEKVNLNSLTKTIDRMPSIEPFYLSINFIAKKLGMSYHVFAGIYASLLTIIILKLLEDSSPYFELSAILYYSTLFIYWNISALRQGLVVILLLYIYFNKRYKFKLWQRLLVVFILFFMHPTAIIVPIIYLVSKFKWGKYEFYFLLAAAPIFREVLKILINIVPPSLPYVGKIFKYMDYDSIRIISAPSFMRIAFIIFIVHHYVRLIKKYPKYRIMFNFSLLSLIGYFYLPTAMVVGTRTTIFGYFLIIIIFPMVLSLYKSKEIYTIVLYGLLGISAISFYNELNKLVDRSAYKYDIHQLNTESIIQKNREHFDK